MHLTQIEVNPRRRGTQPLLASPHRLHGAVNACFPPSGREGRILWRLDETNRGLLLYLLSTTTPDAKGFVEQYGWDVDGSWQTRDYAPVLASVVDRAVFSFRLRANPTHSVRTAKSDEDAPTKRIGHVTADQQRRWLVKRAEAWGISIGDPDQPTFDVVERKVWQFNRSGKRVTISTATYEGQLTVANAGAFKDRLVSGFGPAKAYGCGLLTLAPARQ
ncbi:type I-E CRISPR-associated protein Cas6/Cse3/CasE [Nakamurella aerolata]|uniref:Type I-E CRISPR-associated protein Cas6/Cse3/CasE n=1 Tax=Nakamurella aerolata TaxID=1656892 RepID=A0A849A8J3_9ACTN|nr:type I-E CRISPR-associated protein Cas6/Cse3/CasE [Nakamurella aerolata]NNG35428.1 type I-E CRISPR-associated protein Cas6/Cse3/CasE [Nakamurella aerolata]